MFEAAVQRARYLDHYLATNKKPVGPLHGVPISLKDMVKIAGVDASIGIAALAFKPSLTSAPIVSILLSQGAVLYCKTNIPQTLMALDSENNLFGRTLNPINRHLTAGGSSGGEGVLVAMKGETFVDLLEYLTEACHSDCSRRWDRHWRLHQDSGNVQWRLRHQAERQSCSAG